MQNRKVTGQRVTATKDKLYKALLALMETASIDQVRISELCQLAQINRTTFYNHYGSQYDVLREMAQSFLDHTALVVRQQLQEKADFPHGLELALEYIREHRALLQRLLSQDPNGFPIELPNFEEIILERLPPQLPPMQKKAAAAFLTHGIVGLLLDWIRNGCQESAHEEAQLCLFLFSRIHF